MTVTDMGVSEAADPKRDEPPSPSDRADFSESGLLERMSHDMRTSLGAILGYAQLLEAGTPSPTVSQKRSIDLILQAGWHLEKLINMARDLALLRCGALSLSLAPVSVAEAMGDCRAMLESAAEIRGLRMTFPRLDDHHVVL